MKKPMKMAGAKKASKTMSPQDKFKAMIAAKKNTKGKKVTKTKKK